MAKTTTVTRSSPVFLQGSTAAALFLLGLLGIVNYNSDLARFGRSIVQAFGGKNDVLGLIISILTLIAGILLAADLLVKSSMAGSIGIGVFVFWALRILYVYFRKDIFQPDALVWLQMISPDIVILAAIWMIARSRS
jgi:hypothetical protein